jgi:hypothetical protein
MVGRHRIRAQVRAQCKHAFHSEHGCGVRVEMDVLPSTAPAQSRYLFDLHPDLHVSFVRSARVQNPAEPPILVLCNDIYDAAYEYID